MKRLYKNLILCACMGILACFVACNDDDTDIPDNFYSATSITAAEFLTQNDARFSQFRSILERSNNFTLLSTYGKYTLFAPTNDAVTRYLSDNGYRSVEEIPVDQCDTIARTHIINNGAFFSSDFRDDRLSEMNMNDRYIVISSDSDVTNNNALLYYVNERARIVERDDSVTNGVVHVIDNVLTSSNQFLPDLISDNPKLTIFSQALRLTGMADSISRYVDDSYTCGNDSVYPNGVRKFYGGYWQYARFPAKRCYKYTAFCETDDVYRANGIEDINGLIAYAKSVYDRVYPQDAGLYDADFRHRKNPLNRFISYHLINRYGSIGDWVSSGEIKSQCCVLSAADPEDFYETMAPGTIMRFCSPAHGLFINRKGLARNASVQGVRVLTNSGDEGDKAKKDALNGIYHYIDGILAYTTEVRDVVLNCRIRIDGTTMSPDFMNAGARGHFGEDYLTGFKNDYIADWKLSDETFVGVHSNELHWHSYEGNAVCITGIYDVTMKLPPVPSGTYEIRMGYTVGTERGVVQVYLNNEPCGIPIDLREYGPTPNIGWVADTDDDEENTANDKAMRNRGYMKAMDSYRSAGGNVFRDNTENLRRILTTAYLDSEQTYTLRFRQVLEDPDCYLSFDYLELCPKSVYGSPEGEDRH